MAFTLIVHSCFTIPREVLQNILLLVLRSGALPIDISMRTSLLRVCKLFRQLVEDTSELWTYLPLNDAPFNAVLARQRELHVSLNLRATDLSGLLQIEDLLDSQHGAVTRLEVLAPALFLPLASHVQFFLHIISADIRELAILPSSGIEYELPLLNLKYPLDLQCDALTYPIIYGCILRTLEYVDNASVAMTPTMLFSSLPALEFARVLVARDEAATTRVTLRSIRILIVEGSVRPVFSLLYSVHLPALEKLGIATREAHPDALAFSVLDAAGAKLRRVDLDRASPRLGRPLRYQPVAARLSQALPGVDVSYTSTHPRDDADPRRNKRAGVENWLCLGRLDWKTESYWSRHRI
ncbi:hypothetical protein MKEN_00163600 [Mycena kentingensis (nom. inval.)]|nr:hypothetical protein MKEN_00570400 [Mycena kentingensis (nom. inval.)]KAF7332798.1 hypothetical protein MKEN_00163600 [Mycena kentingensis (nom. inval.)]